MATCDLCRVFVIFSFSLFSVNAYHFLILGGEGGGSHYYVATAIGEQLALRGNNVTVLVSDMYDKESSNRSDTRLLNTMVYGSLVSKEENEGLLSRIVEASLEDDILGLVQVTSLAFDLTSKQCESVLINPVLINTLRQSKIDFIIGDIGYVCVGIVAQALDVPFATLSALSQILSYHAQINACPTNQAYIPELITGLDTKMNFLQRVKNTLMFTMGTLNWRRNIWQHFDQLKVKYNIRPEVSTFTSLSEADLMLINTHFALEFPRPLPPHVIPVGGLTTKPAKPLKKDLETFMQSAEKGVIVFSLGSYCSISKQSMADMFAEALSQVDQKVVWKSKGKTPQRVPDNVKIMNSIPQNDLLGHPKTRLLVYHCGVNGVYEAMYHAVPIVCLPVFLDQFDNAQRVHSRGIGLRVDHISKLTSDKLLTAIKTVLGEDKYLKNMKEVSSIFRDDPKTPAERAADWMEFAARHNGTKHLRSSAHDLNFVQYHLLDVFSFLIGCVALVIFLVIVGCRCCIRCFRNLTQKDKID